jgi:hypothetical protein
MKVSWQVTGIRQDPYANLHRIPIEEEKSPQERGFYLHPEAYGQPVEKRVAWARSPEIKSGGENGVQTLQPKREEMLLQAISPVTLESSITIPAEEKTIEDLKPRERLRQPVPKHNEPKER